MWTKHSRDGDTGRLPSWVRIEVPFSVHSFGVVPLNIFSDSLSTHVVVSSLRGTKTPMKGWDLARHSVLLLLPSVVLSLIHLALGWPKYELTRWPSIKSLPAIHSPSPTHTPGRTLFGPCTVGGGVGLGDGQQRQRRPSRPVGLNLAKRHVWIVLAGREKATSHNNGIRYHCRDKWRRLVKKKIPNNKPSKNVESNNRFFGLSLQCVSESLAWFATWP